MSTRAHTVAEGADARPLVVDDASLRLVDLALAEDIGPGDWSSRWTVPPRARLEGAIVTERDGVIAGVALAAAVFRRLSPRVEVEPLRADGDEVSAGDVVAAVRGPARAILSGERTALDFLRRLSGVATHARRYADALAGTGAAAVGAGKGTPGWRVLEAAALRAGGAQVERVGLHDGLLLRAAHVGLAGSFSEAIRLVKEQNARGLRVEVEAATPEEAVQAGTAGADVVLLTSADPETVRAAAQALGRVRRRVLLAVAADVTPKQARVLAEAGAEAVLVAALPQAAPPLPVILRFPER